MYSFLWEDSAYSRQLSPLLGRDNKAEVDTAFRLTPVNSSPCLCRRVYYSSSDSFPVESRVSFHLGADVHERVDELARDVPDDGGRHVGVGVGCQGKARLALQPAPHARLPPLHQHPRVVHPPRRAQPLHQRRGVRRGSGGGHEGGYEGGQEGVRLESKGAQVGVRRGSSLSTLQLKGNDDIESSASQADKPACNVSRAQGESSGSKWATGHRVRKGEGSLGCRVHPCRYRHRRARNTKSCFSTRHSTQQSTPWLALFSIPTWPASDWSVVRIFCKGGGRGRGRDRRVLGHVWSPPFCGGGRMPGPCIRTRSTRSQPRCAPRYPAASPAPPARGAPNQTRGAAERHYCVTVSTRGAAERYYCVTVSTRGAAERVTFVSPFRRAGQPSASLLCHCFEVGIDKRFVRPFTTFTLRTISPFFADARKTSDKPFTRRFTAEE
eukprot:1180362-Prorocentrum_minimum.AAC.2